MTALQLANRRRIGGDVTALEIWQAARDETTSPTARVRVLRHAFAHAGLLKQKDGTPYRICPDCGRRLTR